MLRHLRSLFSVARRPIAAKAPARLRIAAAAAAGLSLTGAATFAIAQPMNDQQLRCMQLQQELASVRSGGGGGHDELPRIEQEIAQYKRVFRGTESAMENAGCYESFFIFGRGVVRSPRCLSMNDRLEDARRQLRQLQDRRDAISSGRGDRRRVLDLQDALARNGCGGQQASRRGGGLFDWFSGRDRDDYGSDLPVSRSIASGVPYRTVCVRLCDGFYYPISYSSYSTGFGQDAERCQANCAAPAELYVYQNPGQELEQAISLNGSPYVDLPVAFKFRQEYTKGCSCKQAEYNPTEIEAANSKKTQGETGADSTATAAANGGETGTAAPPADGGTEEPPMPGDLQLDLDDGSMMGADDQPADPAAAESGSDAPMSPAAEEADSILNGEQEWENVPSQESTISKTPAEH